MKISIIARAALALLLIGGMGFNANAAKKRTATKKTRTAATAATVKKGASHSYGNGALSTQEFTYKKGKSSLMVEYPVSGDEQLVTTVRNWIKTVMCDQYSGSLTTPDAMMKKTLSLLDRGEEIQVEIKVAYNNDKVITAIYNQYWYGGGAHGGTSIVPATFSLSNGAILTEEMLPSISTLRPYILQGIADAGGLSLEGVKEMCFDSGQIPMGTPYVMADGLNVIYQQYEIAPYVAGLPNAVIPFSKLKGVVSQQVFDRYF